MVPISYCGPVPYVYFIGLTLSGSALFTVGITGLSLKRQLFRGGLRYTLPAPIIIFQLQKC
jgi:hypothetical protein